MAREGKKTERFNSPANAIRDRIILHQTAEMPKTGAFISLNGYAFQVKPGTEIDIPRPVRLMMDTLIYTDMVQEEDGTKYFRDRPRYPYTLIQAGVNDPKSRTADLSPVIQDFVETPQGSGA